MLNTEKRNLDWQLSKKTWGIAVLTQEHAFVHVRNEFRRSFITSYANKTIFAMPSSFPTRKKCFEKLYCNLKHTDTSGCSLQTFIFKLH